jgi:hypothetical protein
MNRIDMPSGACSRIVAAAALLAAAWPGARPAEAQPLPRSPVIAAGGRLAVGGEFTATYGSEDPGYFNYTDYETNGLRRVRARLSLAVSPFPGLTLLADGQAETGSGVEAYAYYARVQPWKDAPVWIQAGRVPPVFGTFARRAYPSANPLIGEPLVYQYLTSVRHDAFPETAQDIVRMRGRGWLARYPVGNTDPAPGLPVVAGTDWDTGVQARVGVRPIELVVSWTVGSLSVPSDWRPNGHGQLAARGVARPWPGLALVASASTGTYIPDDTRTALPAPSRGAGQQAAFGADAEFERGHVIVRGELVVNRWTSPLTADPAGRIELGVVGAYVEGRYRPFAGAHVAVRVEHLAFDRIATRSDGPQPWEANVFRVEAGGGYLITRALMVKACYQFNDRDGGRVRRSHLGAVQVSAWF